MEERNHTSAPETAKKCCCCGWGAFLVGLVVALILGWAVLPALMQKELKQPIAFNHVLHVDEQGIDCAQCHFTGPDGQFSGVPTTATCAVCHAEVIGNDPEEIRFVQDYVQTGREIRPEWLVYLKQPDNVFFSHTVHSVDRCVLSYRICRRSRQTVCGMPYGHVKGDHSSRLFGKQAFRLSEGYHAHVGLRALSRQSQSSEPGDQRE